MAEMKFDYKSVPLRNIEVDLVDVNALTKGEKFVTQGGSYIHGGKAIKAVVIDGEPITPTDRFWSSLYSRFNLNRAFFKYFTHAEVFDRIVDRDRESSVRVCIERNKKTGDSRLLAATGLNKPVVIYDDLMDILETIGVDPGGIQYANGVVASKHEPRINGGQFEIGGDKFSNKFEMYSPIDGYGNPNMYLSLLRLICSNGMVGFARAFQSTLRLGSGADNVRYTLERALDGFQNEEGYAQIRERFEAGTKSWASLREQQSLYRLLINLQGDENITKERAREIAGQFEEVSGRPLEIYHKDPNVFSEKRLRTLPVECKVYDMINFATEVATHDVSAESARKLNAWVGETLSSDYDLEGSCDAFDDWRDFFLQENRQKFEGAKNARKAIDDELDDE